MILHRSELTLNLQKKVQKTLYFDLIKQSHMHRFTAKLTRHLLSDSHSFSRFSSYWINLSCIQGVPFLDKTPKSWLIIAFLIYFSASKFNLCKMLVYFYHGRTRWWWYSWSGVRRRRTLCTTSQGVARLPPQPSHKLGREGLSCRPLVDLTVKRASSGVVSASAN